MATLKGIGKQQVKKTMEGSKLISAADYAAGRNITLQAVTKAIRAGGTLQGVKTIHHFGRFYVLELE